MKLVIFPTGHEAAAVPVVEKTFGRNVRILTHGSLNLGDLQDAIWVDLAPPADNGWLILKSPDPVTGDQPNQWLALEGNQWANTTDLIAVRQQFPTEPPLAPITLDVS